MVSFHKTTEFLDTFRQPRNRKFFYYDIALIKVRKEFEFNKNNNVAPLDLPCEKEDGTYTSVEENDSFKISGRNIQRYLVLTIFLYYSIYVGISTSFIF